MCQHSLHTQTLLKQVNLYTLWFKKQECRNYGCTKMYFFTFYLVFYEVQRVFYDGAMLDKLQLFQVTIKRQRSAKVEKGNCLTAAYGFQLSVWDTQYFKIGRKKESVCVWGGRLKKEIFTKIPKYLREMKIMCFYADLFAENVSFGFSNLLFHELNNVIFIGS